MNIEVSGLPDTSDIDYPQLLAVRELFLNLLSTVTITSSFKFVNPPIKVDLRGSLFFDGQHGAGCKACPGPQWAKPQSVWEVHPIYSITRID
jgi:hypothetical protein